MLQKQDLVNHPADFLPNSHNLSKRLTIILASVLLLTIVGVGGYMLGARHQQSLPSNPSTKPEPNWFPSATPVQQLFPTPKVATNQNDPTTGWNGYDASHYATKYGPAYRFSLKYPPDWTPREHDYGTGFNVNFLSPDYRAPERGMVEEVLSGARVEVSLASKLKADTLSDWVKRVYYYDPHSVPINPRRFSTASGLEGFEFDGPAGAQHDQSPISEASHTKVFTTGDTVYLFKVVFIDDGAKYIVTLDQMISTFTLDK